MVGWSMSGPEPSEAARWLAYAGDDLQSAEALRREELPPRQVCFLAQQAAEKALKAILLARGIEFARTHDLVALRRLLTEDPQGVPADEDLAELTQWAMQARYPGDFPEATPHDADRALRAAERMLHAASATIHQ